MPVEVPAELASQVSMRTDGLYVTAPRSESRTTRFFLIAVAMGFIVFMLMGLVFCLVSGLMGEGVALAVLMITPVIVAPMPFVAIGLSMVPRYQVVRPGGLELGGFVKSIVTGPVTISGDPGDAIQFHCEDRVWFEVTPDPVVPWTLAHVEWLMEAVVQISGLALVDQRDPALWERWRTDPVHRGRVAVDALLKKNRTDFPTEHGREPLLPKMHETHDGVRVGMKFRRSGYILESAPLSIDATKIQVGDFSVPLAEVRRAYVYYQRVGKKTVGILAVWTERGEFELGRKQLASWSGGRMSGLNALPAWIEGHLSHARALEGSADEVPDELRQLRDKAPQ